MASVSPEEHSSDEHAYETEATTDEEQQQDVEAGEKDADSQWFCRRHWKGCCCCCFFTLLAIFLLVFFLYPRIPETGSNSMDSKPKNFSYSAAPPAIVFDFEFPVWVKNDNYYAATVDQAIALAYYKEVPFCRGSLVDVTFPSMTNKTVVVDMTVRREILNSPAETAKIAGYFQADCGVPPNPDNTIEMEVDLDLEISALGLVNRLPINLTFPVTFSCNG